MVHLANSPVVTLRCLGQERLVIRQLFLVREGNPVDTLQRVVVRITEEIRCRILKRDDSKNKRERPHGLTLVIMKALIFPVWGMWGPTHRSTIGPQR